MPQPAYHKPHDSADRPKPVSLSRLSGRLLVNGYQAQSRQGSALDTRLSRLLAHASSLSVALTMQQEAAPCLSTKTATQGDTAI